MTPSIRRSSSSDSLSSQAQEALEQKDLQDLVNTVQTRVHAYESWIATQNKKVKDLGSRIKGLYCQLRWCENSHISHGRMKKSDRTVFEEKTPELERSAGSLGLYSAETLVIGRQDEREFFNAQLKNLHDQLSLLDQQKKEVTKTISKLESKEKDLLQLIKEREELYFKIPHGQEHVEKR
ncbi:MAG: hypothetical protein H7A40_05895 [Chlamydiales bacterium]|nr:hypothetical protein [Chlamydiales bacterium]